MRKQHRHTFTAVCQYPTTGCTWHTGADTLDEIRAAAARHVTESDHSRAKHVVHVFAPVANVRGLVYSEGGAESEEYQRLSRSRDADERTYLGKAEPPYDAFERAAYGACKVTF